MHDSDNVQHAIEIEIFESIIGTAILTLVEGYTIVAEISHHFFASVILEVLN